MNRHVLDFIFETAHRFLSMSGLFHLGRCTLPIRVVSRFSWLFISVCSVVTSSRVFLCYVVLLSVCSVVIFLENLQTKHTEQDKEGSRYFDRVPFVVSFSKNLTTEHTEYTEKK
jgi:hypothetical protein